MVIILTTRKSKNTWHKVKGVLSSNIYRYLKPFCLMSHYRSNENLCQYQTKATICDASNNIFNLEKMTTITFPSQVDHNTVYRHRKHEIQQVQGNLWWKRIAIFRTLRLIGITLKYSLPKLTCRKWWKLANSSNEKIDRPSPRQCAINIYQTILFVKGEIDFLNNECDLSERRKFLLNHPRIVFSTRSKTKC